MKEKSSKNSYDAVIIGAGFAGLQQLHFLRDRLGLSVVLLETAPSVGGTWYWNRYPGARCDSESHTYCFYFNKKLLNKWRWSERYPSQEEILRYLNFVADELDLRRSIKFQSTVCNLDFDQGKNFWHVSTRRKVFYQAQFVISAVGCLSSPYWPKIKGKEKFLGEFYHTGYWPHHNVSFEGKRIAVIGTGSSGIQTISEIAKKAEQLIVFQRTANFSIPARNKELTNNFFEEFKSEIDNYRREMLNARHGHPWSAPETSVADTPQKDREHLLEEAWKIGGLRFRESFGDTLTNLKSNEIMSSFIEKKIKSIVKDPEKAKILCNFNHPFGTKRPALDTNYFETFNSSNVELVDLRKEKISKLTSNGIKTNVKLYPLDMIVLATGFDALTGTLLKMNIKGKDGQLLSEVWKYGPKTYLGIQVHGFPNLFIITGPGSPSVLTNMPQSIDQHVSWITDCIAYLLKHQYSSIEPLEDSVTEWMKHSQGEVKKTLFALAESSWYLGANIPGKTKTFMPYVGGLNKYRKICDEVATKEYNGFMFKRKSKL